MGKTEKFEQIKTLISGKLMPRMFCTIYYFPDGSSKAQGKIIRHEVDRDFIAHSVAGLTTEQIFMMEKTDFSKQIEDERQRLIAGGAEISDGETNQWVNQICEMNGKQPFL